MQEPLVSIIITNHNYGHFLREAIDSALVQTYPHIEVIVVDDGSTDDSREIITSYKDQIVPILKTNGGHTPAINTGFSATNGELICWLDSDDIFFSNKVDQVVKAHRTHPEAVLIYHRLQIIDSAGVKKHRPWPRDVWAGSLQDRVVRSGGWWPRPTTSAMVFTRTFLERLHPMPECSIAGRATWPDAYAGDLAPFLGDVVGLRDALACYRLHGRNNSQTQFNAKIRADQHVYEREQLQRGLSCFGIDISLNDIDCNFGYIRESYVLHRDASARRMFWLIATCPFLSFSSRIRELAKLAVRRR